MNVVLTCGCGRRQEVSIALAGTTAACAGCGKALAVPALGIAVGQPRRAATPAGPAAPRAFDFAAPSPAVPRAVPRQRSSGAVVAITLVAGGLLLIGLGGLGIWMFGLHEHLPSLAFLTRGHWEPMPPAVEPVPDLPAPRVAPAPSPPDAAPPVPMPAEPLAVTIAKPASPAPAKPAEPIVAKPADPPAVKPAEPVIAKPAEPVIAKPALPFKVDDTFLQELLVTQKSRFVVQGLPVATLLQYRVVSRFTVAEAQADGSLVVRQKVESAALLQADELTQGLLAGPVAQLPGTGFTLSMSPRGEVTKLAGAGDAMQVAAAKLPGGLGVQLASLMDADGWKELAQATFFQPERRDKPGRWSHALTHTWGPLGDWAGAVTYAYPGPGKDPQVKVGYQLKLAYQAPKGPGAPGALPLKIAGANFQPAQAGGTILYDTQRGRTVAVEERFHVRGRLTLMLLGQNTPAEIEEEQLFQMRIMEQVEGK